MLSVKRPHLTAPMIKLQREEICHCPLLPSAVSSLSRGQLPINATCTLPGCWHSQDNSDKCRFLLSPGLEGCWQESYTNFYSSRTVSSGFMQGGKCIVSSLGHRMEKSMRMDPREILNMVLNLLMMLFLLNKWLNRKQRDIQAQWYQVTGKPSRPTC